MEGATRSSKLLVKFGRAPRRQPASGNDLVHRHFLLQDQRPEHVEAVEIASLDPFLRSLLFTDGTVTRALAVQTLAPVAVERVDQVEVLVPAAIGAQLETDPGETSIRRRVRIGIGAPVTPVLWAESFLVPDRLPPGFVGLLDSAPDGIGQSLQRIALESYRELLWFGFDAAPEWAEAGPAASRRTIRRLYRVLSERQASILISESFAVEQRAGVFHLSGLAGAESAGEAG
jgi:chorismate-pyruvate lyase